MNSFHPYKLLKHAVYFVHFTDEETEGKEWLNEFPKVTHY